MPFSSSSNSFWTSFITMLVSSLKNWMNPWHEFLVFCKFHSDSGDSKGVWCWLTFPRRWAQILENLVLLGDVYSLSHGTAQLFQNVQFKSEKSLFSPFRAKKLEVFQKAFGVMGSSGKHGSLQPYWISSWPKATARGLIKNLMFSRAR